jgi:hypothetical protein
MPGQIKIDDGSGNYTILTNGGSLGSDKTITLPNTTGTVALTSDSFGKVLQVVNAVISTRETTTATTQQNSALTATITPSSTSNKVLCLVSYQVGASADIWMFVNLDRGGTTIGGSVRHNPFASSINRLEAGSINYLDSPSSTSALTYTVQYGSTQAGTKIFNGRNSGSSDSYATLTLMEIAG